MADLDTREWLLTNGLGSFAWYGSMPALAPITAG